MVKLQHSGTIMMSMQQQMCEYGFKASRRRRKASPPTRDTEPTPHLRVVAHWPPPQSGKREKRREDRANFKLPGPVTKNKGKGMHYYYQGAVKR